MPKQTARSEKTRQRIMSYALHLFFDRGFRRVTVEEICTGVAVSKRTFYKYFPNRDALVEAMIADRLGRVGPKVMANLRSDKPVREIMKVHYQLLNTEIFRQVSSQIMIDIQTLMPELWQQIISFRNLIFAEIGKLIYRGQQDGTLRGDIDPEIAGKLVQGILNQVANPNFAAEMGLTMDQLAASLLKILWTGMMASEPEGEEK